MQARGCQIHKWPAQPLPKPWVFFHPPQAMRLVCAHACMAHCHDCCQQQHMHCVLLPALQWLPCARALPMCLSLTATSLPLAPTPAWAAAAWACATQATPAAPQWLASLMLARPLEPPGQPPSLAAVVSTSISGHLKACAVNNCPVGMTGGAVEQHMGVVWCGVV